MHGLEGVFYQVHQVFKAHGSDEKNGKNWEGLFWRRKIMKTFDLIPFIR